MAKYFSERNLRFLLYDVFKVQDLAGFSYYGGYDGKFFDMVIKAAAELADGLLYPSFQEMDRNPPELTDQGVKVHPCVKTVLKEFGKGGWIAATLPEEHGGQQLPHLVADSCNFMFAASNYSASAYPSLTAGAAHLIESFGSKDLFDTYVPRMLAGEWQGTMALTEPEAGSSLSDITTSATPAKHGHYLIQGQKIFISAGDHDAVENVIHLMLAKIRGAPPGVRGISLFVVPKMRADGNGNPIPNDVTTSGIFHKMGYRGCPAVQLSMGDRNDCHGYLVGQPHHGLAYMFQMMNEARIGVGMGAAAMATAAYYASIDYSKKRRQGRKITEKDPTLPPAPIIEHADIKRMLLFQRAVCEGSLALLLQCSRYVDMLKVCRDDERERYELLLEILTPVAKSYPSEMGIQSVSQGLQCFGGSGYCDDYPLEQYYRDARIHPIHEGTTGIQGIDLLGRKVVMKDGKAFELFRSEVNRVIGEAGKITPLIAPAEQLSKAMESLTRVTVHLRELLREKGPEYSLADAVLYLEFFGITAVAWQWLLQAVSVQAALNRELPAGEERFFQGKFFAFRYFFNYELPKTKALTEILTSGDSTTVEMREGLFAD